MFELFAPPRQGGYAGLAMSTDPTAPATKADVQMLLQEIGKFYDASASWKEEIKGHFDFTIETIRHDLTGANRDRLELHEDRLGRIEGFLGVEL